MSRPWTRVAPYRRLRMLRVAPLTLLAVAACARDGTAATSLPPAAEAPPLAQPADEEAPSDAVAPPADDDLRDAVRRALLDDGPIDARRVLVGVTHGVVLLTGEVDSLLMVDRATEIAGGIVGVRSVVSRLTIAPSTRSDAQVAEDVRRALAYDGATHAYGIDVSVHDGHVTLRGDVDSWAERDLASQTARGVVGVLGVDDEIQMENVATRPPDDIAADVRARLMMDSRIADRSVAVAVEDGKVVLTGAVGSVQERNRAFRLAAVKGVTDVDVSKLEVDPARRGNFRWPGDEILALTSAEIQRGVEEALLLDPRVSGSEVEVAVHDHQATLTGTVNNVAAQEAAEADARNTTGVWRVYDFVVVEPDPPIPDAQIARDVLARLSGDPCVGDDHVFAEVKEGRISLIGLVDTPYDRLRAEDVAKRIDGAVEVEDQLEVRRVAPVALDWELEHDLRHDLHWNPVLDGERIDVEVHDGVVTLRGRVHDVHAYAEVLEAAYDAGARKVRSEALHVETGPAELQAKSARKAG